jgi:SAM-dependent methyltransferase
MDKSHLNPTIRFSNRAENYVKYRPHYPDKIIDYLKTKEVLKSDSVISDIGSGTGFSSELFLKNGNIVYGIEPNKEMRKEGEKYLSLFRNFVSVNGSAENTTLKPKSIDIITAGQAFHWFDFPKAKKEFKRISKPGAFLVLIWNKRKFNESGLNRDYENLLIEFGTDYKEVAHRSITKNDYDNFFEGKYITANFYNEQLLDFTGLKGRLLSSSYVPDESKPVYSAMIKELKMIFIKYSIKGKVLIQYTTGIYYGKIGQ